MGQPDGLAWSLVRVIALSLLMGGAFWVIFLLLGLLRALGKF